MSKRLEVTLGNTGITLQNPIMSASGCFGFGREAAAIYDLDVLGGYIVKSTTLEPRKGNDVIRIAETPGGMLNAIGLQNPGVHKIVETELPWLHETFSQPIFVNLAGSSIEDYVETAKILSQSSDLHAVELNISCPNVKEGGIQFGTDPDVAAKLTAAIKAESNVPVFVKLSPNVTSITDMAKAVVDAGADGLSLINTLVGMRLDPKTGKPLLANKTGGFSGPAILPVAVRAIYEVASIVDVPIIGMGGVSSPADVVELMSAGATAVAVGSATFPNPFAMPEIIEALPAYLDTLGVDDIKDIIGRAHK